MSDEHNEKWITSTVLLCPFCGSDKVTTEHDIGFNIDSSGEERQHIDHCECGAWRFHTDRIHAFTTPKKHFGKWHHKDDDNGLYFEVYRGWTPDFRSPAQRERIDFMTDDRQTDESPCSPKFHPGRMVRVLHTWAAGHPARPVVRASWDASWNCYTYELPCSLIMIEEHELEATGEPDIDPDVWVAQYRANATGERPASQSNNQQENQ